MKAIITLILCAFAFARSKAQIVYMDVNPDSVINGSYNLDLNNDGIADFVIKDSGKAPVVCAHGQLRIATKLTITPSAANNMVTGDGVGYARALVYNSAIVPDSLWADTSQVMFDQAYGCSSNVSGYWLLQIPLSVSPDDRYLGLRIKVNNNTYYGWARLSFGTTSPPKLKAYAYNGVPGQSIEAGQGFPQTTPAIQWQKSLGGSNYDDPNSIQQTNDGGYIVFGVSGSNDGDVSGNHGVDDYWLVKLNTNGALQWQKSIGGSSYEGGGVSALASGMSASIRQTSDGGYIMAGCTQSNDGDVSGNHTDPDTLYGAPISDYWIVKLNSSGVIQWQKCLGGRGDDRANSIQQTADGGYIVAGYSGSDDGDVSGHHGDYYTTPDYWVVKLDNSGSIMWQKCLGGSGDDEASSFQQTKDGGYIVAGTSSSNDGDVTGNHSGSSDYWVVKLDNNGNLVWQKSLGGSGNEEAYSIQQTNDGGYIVAGSTLSNDGDLRGNHNDSIDNPTADYWIVKLNSSGSIEWQKNLGGSGSDIATSIQQTIDGGYIVAGYTFSHDGDVIGIHDEDNDWDEWVIKLSNTGDIVWQKCLGGTPNDLANSIQQTNDGGYIVAGWSNSDDYDVSGNHGYEDFWVAKLAPDIVLPLQLISFNGTLANNVATLNWQSGTEENFKQFELEKSTDGKIFTTIATIAAKGSNSDYTYSTPQKENIAFYRLKITDIDAKFTYSKVIPLTQSGASVSIKISPVPAHDAVTITGAGNFTTVQFIDVSGRIVKQFGKMQNNLFPIADLTKGIYFIRLVSGSDSRIFKIIKE